MISSMAIPGSGRRVNTRVPDLFSPMDARYISAKVVSEVIMTRKHLDQLLATQLMSVTDLREKSLARELCYGIMRWHPRLSFITDMLLNKPLKAKDAEILALIYSGLYQFMFLRIPDHAAISATVETARKFGKPWATELINAILRRYQREQTAIEKKIKESESALYSHPDWLISTIRHQWPDYWQTILEANNQHPPMQLRVNLRIHSRENYLQNLASMGIEATPSKTVNTGVTLAKPLNVEDIPGFQTGDVSVQDFAAQLAVPLLDAKSGHRVLDACAAPGGKTGHIHEHTPDLQKLVAVEIDAARMELLRNTTDRLKLNIKLMHADINEPATWWDGKPFDRILLDAPCSATGVIRRHPDIKYLRTPDQLTLFTQTQGRMLETLWPLLKPGGRLVYVTCSILREESDEQIATFANKYDDMEFKPIDSDWGIKSQFGRHTLPGHDETDGFYYSVIIKTS